MLKNIKFEVYNDHKFLSQFLYKFSIFNHVSIKINIINYVQLDIRNFAEKNLISLGINFLQCIVFQ